MGRLREAINRRATTMGHRLFGNTAPPDQRHALVGPPQLWALKRRFQFQFLTSQGLRPEHRLLDIGCGTLRGGIPLIEYLEPGHYTGVEAREKVLAEGRKELAEAGLEHKLPTLIHADDPAKVHLQLPVDVAWAFSVLIHMTDEIVDATLGLVARGLIEGGSFYANVMLGSRPEGQWQGFPVVSRSRELYADLASQHGLAMSDLGTLAALGYPKASNGGRGSMLLFSRRGG